MAVSKSKTKAKESKRAALEVAPALRDELKIAAIRRGLSLGEATSAAIRMWIDFPTRGPRSSTA